MATCIGIMCHKCETVYFLASVYKHKRISCEPRNKDSYRLACPAPCLEVTSFDRSRMKPYLVSEYSHQRGYAKKGDYREIAA